MTNHPHSDRSGSGPSARWTYGVKHGGLMRCCLASLDEAMVERVEQGLGPPEEGDTLACRYEATGSAPKMVFRSGYWQWIGVGDD